MNGGARSEDIKRFGRYMITRVEGTGEPVWKVQDNPCGRYRITRVEGIG